MIIMECAAQLRDRLFGVKQSARRSVAEGDDNARSRRRHLSMKIRREERKDVGRNLIAGRDVFDRVRQITLVALETYAAQNAFEHQSGRPHEGTARVYVGR